MPYAKLHFGQVAPRIGSKGGHLLRPRSRFNSACSSRRMLLATRIFRMCSCRLVRGAAERRSTRRWARCCAAAASPKARRSAHFAARLRRHWAVRPLPPRGGFLCTLMAETVATLLEFRQPHSGAIYATADSHWESLPRYRPGGYPRDLARYRGQH
jgi:hypothetical protein